jgi:hypothetical protein
LSEEIKKYDGDAVRAFPNILAQAGFEIISRSWQILRISIARRRINGEQRGSCR